MMEFLYQTHLLMFKENTNCALLNKCVLLYVNKSEKEKQAIDEYFEHRRKLFGDEKKNEGTEASNQETLW